jgi:hypothetical protein
MSKPSVDFTASGFVRSPLKMKSVPFAPRISLSVEA